jgi:hypothetical protein
VEAATVIEWVGNLPAHGIVGFWDDFSDHLGP